MKNTLLETQEDLQWLADIHKIPVTGIKVAILYGNEDWPDKVETYTKNHIDCVPTVYRFNGEGKAYYAGEIRPIGY